VSAVKSWASLVMSIAVASLTFSFLGSPSPLMFGGMVGALFIALKSPRRVPALPRTWFLFAQGVVGTAVATQVDSRALHAFVADWPAILLVTIATLSISVVIGQFLRFHGVSPTTATFASIAGGASGMTALADDLGADDRVVTVVQYLRVLVILLSLPVVISTVFPAAGSAVAPHTDPSTPRDVAYVVISVVIGLVLGRLARLPSPGVLGPLLVGGAIAYAPVFNQPHVPAWVQAAAFLIVGSQVGLKFTRESLVAISRMLPTAIACIVVIIVACAAMGILLSALTSESAMDSYLATTPGGLPAVLAISASTSGNVTFISAVQLMRLLTVLLLAPFVTRYLNRRSARDDNEG
jgi:membrane AbrB-like protein